MHNTAVDEFLKKLIKCKTSSVLAGSEGNYCCLVMHISTEQGHSLVVRNEGAAEVDFFCGREKCSERKTGKSKSGQTDLAKQSWEIKQKFLLVR